MEEGLHIPRIIRFQEEWAKNKVIGPPPTWKESQRRSAYSVYGGPWPRWKQTLCRLTGLSCCLPSRVI